MRRKHWAGLESITSDLVHEKQNVLFVLDVSRCSCMKFGIHSVWMSFEFFMALIQSVELMPDNLHYENHSSPSNPAMGLCLVSEEVSETSSSIGPPASHWTPDRSNASHNAASF